MAGVYTKTKNWPVKNHVSQRLLVPGIGPQEQGLKIEVFCKGQEMCEHFPFPDASGQVPCPDPSSWLTFLRDVPGTSHGVS